MTAPTWPPEVVEAVAERLWEYDVDVVMDEMDFEAPSWKFVSETDRARLQAAARSLLNAIAEAGAGKVGVKARDWVWPRDKAAYFVTPAPLEEK